MPSMERIQGVPHVLKGDRYGHKHSLSNPQIQNCMDSNAVAVVQKTKRICKRCNGVITENSLKALGNYYHEYCLVCHDCGASCKPKFFPYELPETSQVVILCQKDYFTRNKLLCHVCKKPLSGVYYSTFDKLYDEEHFCCTLCGVKCKVSSCFHYNYELYCKYHFLKYFSNRCKGCNYPISDQYIEFPRGGEIYCWHPECYGIHKYWHVNMPPEAVGVPTLPMCEIGNHRDIKDMNPSREEMEKYTETLTGIICKTWNVLYRFEEETASCISDMFQYLTSYDQFKGVDSTALFVLKLECLFKALDSLETIGKYTRNKHSNNYNGISALSAPELDANEDMNLKYSKFPRNLCMKIMIYLQLLRKLGTASQEKEVNVGSFMSVITSIAHLLKLIVRYGLFNALEHNKTVHTSNALIKFLREIKKNENYQRQPFDYINVTINATDSCNECEKYVQEECIQFRDARWHIGCFKCSNCDKHIELHDIDAASYNVATKLVYCARCAIDVPEAKNGFKQVSKLSQLIFLLKIAVVRSRIVMALQMKNQEAVQRTNSIKETMSMQQTYIRTLNDIKRLRSGRKCVRITNNQQDARKSRVLETAEMDVNNSAKRPNDSSLVIETESTKASESNNPMMFNGQKTLTLDDISRIVAAEQARELRPNAFTHFMRIKESDDENTTFVSKKSGVYYSELSPERFHRLQLIALALLSTGKIGFNVNESTINTLIPPNPKSPTTSGGFWNKLFKGRDSKATKHKKVFGTALEIVCERWGVDSDLSSGPAKIRIPIVVDELVSGLRQMDMSVEGIFRKNGNIRRLKELTAAIDEFPSEVPDLTKENAIQLSALLKKFLRELPIPLLTFKLYDLWIQAAKLESELDGKRIFPLLFTLLPASHRNVAEVLFSFLHWTSSFSHVDNQIGSKMDIHNLSTVIAPNILYQEFSNSTTQNNTPGVIHNSYNDAFAQNEGEDYFLAIETVDFLINNNEDLSMVPMFMSTLLNQIEELNLVDFQSIRKHINNMIEEGKINFKDFVQQDSIQVKKAASVTKMRDVTNN
ncbi:HBR556Cp [Eremothecium sinecaudum]|uniref:HBR556Cp n=1 Tax=Eremothecium sinecaudum TaxID=45286 RepID=A0A120K1K2_9SACH|nr:HBR556Cp [Eremothecium sinecaudum]AMD19457.1 HBR556Cp [Eremothecium sinecaudum]